MTTVGEKLDELQHIIEKQKQEMEEKDRQIFTVCLQIS